MIGGLTPCSFIDFPGQLAAVLFMQGCNLRCRYCHNPQLCYSSGGQETSLGDISGFLTSRRDKLTAVVVSGGEPSLHKDLPHLLRTARSLGFAVKIDTNGTRPDTIRRLILENLVDYVAVDVKVAPGSSSQWLCGVEHQAESALETLRFLVEAGIPCEARTTVVRSQHDSVGLDTIARALALAGVGTWRLQPVRASRVLDPSVPLAPPEQSVLSHAIDTAASLGIDAASRSLLHEASRRLEYSRELESQQ